MPPETSNAPRELWAVIDPALLHEGFADADGILPTGVISTTTDQTAARMSALSRDQALNRTRPERKHLPTGYVRRDLVVPTVDEARQFVARMSLEGYESYDAAAQVLRSALQSRIEGDDDANR